MDKLMPQPTQQDILKQETLLNAKETIRIQAQAIADLENNLDSQFSQCCEILLNTKGRVIIIGMGKSGHIARKIAATLSSTGTPAFFVHPAEASHGDLGMITINDCVLMISNSGSSDEVTLLLPYLKDLGVPIISITSAPESPLAKVADVHINTAVKKEACPFNITPTVSTTCVLVLGDAIAIALLKAKEFTLHDFARSHPAGALGRNLCLTVENVMKKGEFIPAVNEKASVNEAIIEMSKKSLGMTAVVDQHQHLLAVFTDGDLRRALENNNLNRNDYVLKYATKNCLTAKPTDLALTISNLLKSKKMNGLFVVDEKNCVVGGLNFHTLIEAKIF